MVRTLQTEDSHSPPSTIANVLNVCRNFNNYTIIKTFNKNLTSQNAKLSTRVATNIMKVTLQFPTCEK